MNRLILTVCAVFLLSGCYTASVKDHVAYRIDGSSHTVRLDSMWINNNECHCPATYVNLPWVYRFDGVPELTLGFTASKYDTGYMHLSISVNGRILDTASVPRGDVGGTAEVWGQWP